ncbi:RagB/SusD family nutrient uptake outer membrane protein [Carboxylicivirga sp. A043]|uniref:RagB/SusD family nutrient uptake outer membrane protein n=1 Tax=Carboxylicivirga litoralis TaxID=2816963 RepID=UPI0021CB35BC|nr:RagB/SusD family nutrient uptake outer membrane protein [Carboxylicivirga sp. A043]MCU4157816.1 RagB/SusD family nutrient uptake outer membrane protein [Carboxylicivirga sp. A043]
MKLKQLYILGLLALLTACSDDFFNHEPTDKASQEQIDELLVTDPEAVVSIAKANVAGIYTDMFKYRTSHDDFGVKAMELGSDMMTDDIAYNRGWFVFDYRLDNRAAAYRRPRSCWALYYELIRGANNAIGLLKPEDETTELTEEHESILGQAYAARGYSYFGLINRFQHPYRIDKNAPGIPIYTEDLVLASRQPVADVYDLIISDLKNAYKLLEGKGKSKPEELNEYAVAAIMANVLSFVTDYPNQWEEVAKYCDLAIKGGELLQGSELHNGFNSVDMKEVLWGSRINAETCTFYASFPSHIDPYGEGYAGGLSQYKEVASELIDGVDEKDERSKWFHNKTVEGVTYQVCSKFRDVGGFESDYVYYRVAEMYFLKAEALLLVGDESGAKMALEAVMKTRNSEYNTTTAKRTLKEEIYFQKRIECWGDGKRFLDMVRRGEALDRTKSNNHHATVIKQVPANDNKFIYQIPQNELDANSEINDEDQNP